MDTPRYLIIPKSAEGEVRKLLKLHPAQLVSLVEELLSDEHSLGAELPFESVAEKLGLSNADALAVINAVRNLARQTERYDLSFDAFLTDLGALFKDEVASLTDAVRDGLRELVGEGASRALTKARGLRFGYVPHATACRSICDLRPVFDADRGVIEKAIVLTVIEFDVHDHMSGEHRKVAVQLSPKALKELEQCLEAVAKKRAVIKDLLGSTVTLLDLD